MRAPVYGTLPAVVLALAAALLAEDWDAAPCSTDRESVARALSLELISMEPLTPPGEDALERVALVTDWTAEQLATIEVYAAERKGEPAVTIARVPVGAGEPLANALIAVQEDMSFVRAAIVTADDAIIQEWQHFMDVLKWHEVPRMRDARPRSYLRERRAEAEQGKDEESRLVLGLLSVMQSMQEQASVFNLPDGSRVLGSPAEELMMMSGEYAKVAELAPDLEPLLGSAGTEEFARLADDASRAAEELALMVEFEDTAGQSEVRERLMGNCLECHEIRVPESGAFLKSASAAARTELGIGNGFYVVGHDLRIRHPERERAQTIADALRRGALLIDARREEPDPGAGK